MRSFIQKVSSDDKQSQLKFEAMLNNAFDNVMTHFRENFPNKKPRYYQLVSFLFAGFSTATICVIIPEYNKHNVYVEKSRLKQTLQESEIQYKDQFLRLIS